MNWLAHFWLAHATGTSLTGQLLGDTVKGDFQGRFGLAHELGIRLHRAIDSFSDRQAEHAGLRQSFDPPLRRYAGILVDIGFDHALARHWHEYSQQPLHAFARCVTQQLEADWPAALASWQPHPTALAAVLASYDRVAGIEHALASVDRRLKRASPLGGASAAIVARNGEFERLLPRLLERTREHTEHIARRAQCAARGATD